MKTGKLLWGTTWRGGVWGLLAGLILGVIYGLSIILILTVIDIAGKNSSTADARSTVGLGVLGVIFGALFGAPTGLFAGAMDGLAIGILTRLFFTPLKNVGMYRLIIALISGLFTLIAAGLGLFVIMILMSAVLDTGVLLLIITIPSIIAGIAAALISILITRWYKKESAK